MSGKWMASAVLFLCGMFFTVFPPESSAKTFRWKDSEGNTFITQDYSQIPEEYKESAEEIKEGTEGKGAAKTPSEPKAERVQLKGSEAAPEGSAKSSSAAKTEGNLKDKMGNPPSYWRAKGKEKEDQIRKLEEEIKTLREERTHEPIIRKERARRTAIQEKEEKIKEIKKELEIDLPKEALSAGANPAWLTQGE